MQKRYTPIAVFIVCMALVALVGYVIPAPTADMPTRILLDNAGGKVVFDHKVHAEKYNIECQKCHHESPTARPNVQPCGSCHGAVGVSGSPEAEAFKLEHPQRFKNDLPSCVTCHHMEFKPSKWGHDEHAQDYGVDCRQCHHTDLDIEPEPQNCASCHDSKGDATVPALSTAVHSKCAPCHQEKFDEKVKGCASCHTKVPMRQVLAETGKAPLQPLYANCQSCHEGQKNADLILPRMGAFHGSCIKCHESLGKGPYKKDQCNQCHTK